MFMRLRVIFTLTLVAINVYASTCDFSRTLVAINVYASTCDCLHANWWLILMRLRVIFTSELVAINVYASTCDCLHAHW